MLVKMRKMTLMICNSCDVTVSSTRYQLYGVSGISVIQRSFSHNVWHQWTCICS